MSDGFNSKLGKSVMAHFDEDKKNFRLINESLKKQEDYHKIIGSDINEIKETMKNLEGLSRFLEGANMLSKPVMWLVGFLVSIISIIGGIVTFGNWLGWFRK